MAMEEPVERAVEEKEVELKSAERKTEKMGSEAKEERGEEGVDAVVEGRSLKVEMRWSGYCRGVAGDAIVGSVLLRLLFHTCLPDSMCIWECDYRVRFNFVGH